MERRRLVDILPTSKILLNIHLATSRRRSILGFRLHQVCGSLKRRPAELKWLGVVHLFLRRERLGCWAWVWRRNAMKTAYVLRG